MVTVGLEFEYENIPSRWGAHDGSVESERNKLGHIELPSFFDKGEPVRCGGEFISPILYNEEQIKEYVFSTIKIFINNGEFFESYKASLHIHVGMPKLELGELKNILRNALLFEDIFFQIGGMGYEHRGNFNNFKYCRPLRSPHLIPHEENENTYYFKIFEVDDILEAKTLQGFWTRMGDLPHTSRRYHPARYVWLNLLNLYPGYSLKNTLEFRVFNKTLNPVFVLAVIELCQAFAEKAPREIFKNGGGYSSLFDWLELSEETREILIRIYDNSLVDRSALYAPVITHVGAGIQYYTSTRYHPTVFTLEEV